MRIIGGHDYYDTALAYGRDDDVLFIRKSKIVDLKSCPLIPHFTRYTFMKAKAEKFSNFNRIIVGGDDYYVKQVSLYLAGKHYGGLVARSFRRDERYFWNYDEFVSFLDSHGYELCRYSWSVDDTMTVREWMTTKDATREQFEFLVQNKIVMALYESDWANTAGRPTGWLCNSADQHYTLKDRGFARVIDPYTAFQEISMWVGGVLPKDGPPMVEITDQKVKAQKHGFDEWSFRKKKVV